MGATSSGPSSPLSWHLLVFRLKRDDASWGNMPLAEYGYRSWRLLIYLRNAKIRLNYPFFFQFGQYIFCLLPLDPMPETNMDDIAFVLQPAAPQKLFQLALKGSDLAGPELIQGQ